MKASVKAALITGVLGIVGSIVTAIIGKNIGEENAVQQLYSQITTINGNNNTVTVNSVDDFVTQYNKLLNENETLKIQNFQYFADYTEQKNINNSLELELQNNPVISYSDLALIIDVNDIPINKSKSMIIVDGREYFSKEIVENLIPKNKHITIKDNTIFVGTVIKEKENLFKQNIYDKRGFNIVDAITDSYNNNYSSVLCTSTSNQFSSLYTNCITYNLDEKYSKLIFSIAIRENADPDSTGILTVKADDEVIYISETLSKKTKVFTTPELSINNCILLTIEYVPSNHYVDCIISDAIVFN